MRYTWHSLYFQLVIIMLQNTSSTSKSSSWVHESRFGNWFLSTHIWQKYVLEKGLHDLYQLLNKENAPQQYTHIIDIGCGHGLSIPLLHAQFQPQKMTAIDIDPQVLSTLKTSIAKIPDLQNKLLLSRQTATQLAVPDNSVDMIVCHQTLHHISDQSLALQEFYRILKPGGVVLLSESCQRFIVSWVVRLFFRHPMSSQKTATEYLQLLTEQGFTYQQSAVSYPYLWWSRPDFGLIELFTRRCPASPEPTLINVIARKPIKN